MSAREALRLRVYLGEGDRRGGEALYRVVVKRLRDRGVRGATALRGLYGYGRDSVLHSARAVDVHPDLPIIVEAVDEAARIREVLPDVLALVDGALVTTERVTRHTPDASG